MEPGSNFSGTTSTTSSVKSNPTSANGLELSQRHPSLPHRKSYLNAADVRQLQKTIGNQSMIQLIKKQATVKTSHAAESRPAQTPVAAQEPAAQLQALHSAPFSVIQRNEEVGKVALAILGSLVALLGAVLVKKIFFSGESVPASATDWKAKLDKLDEKKEHTFNTDGDLVVLDGSLSLHYLKLTELDNKGMLSDLMTASQSAEADAGSIDHDHELVKSGGERLRFEHHLNEEVDQFIVTYVTDPVDQDKVKKFFIGSDTEKQDRMRFFDLVNDNLNPVLKKKASAYAAKKADNARLFANHYTYYAANNPTGSKLDTEVESDYETAKNEAASESYAKQSLRKANTEEEAIRFLKNSSDSLSFENIEAAVSHLEKHPLQDNSNQMKNYLSWARLAVKKGDAEASRNQFDAGWSLSFNYGGQLVNARLQEDGKAFLTSYTPQQSSYKPSAETFHYDPKPPRRGAGKISLKSQSESVRKLIQGDSRLQLVSKQTFSSLEAEFEIKANAQSITIKLQQGNVNDCLIQSGTEFTFMLNSDNKSELANRVQFLWAQFMHEVESTTMDMEEKTDFLQDNLLANIGKDKDYEELFNAYASGQLELNPNHSDYDRKFHVYANFVKTTIEQIAMDTEMLNAQLRTKKPQTDPEIMTLTEEISKLQAEVEKLQKDLKTATDKKAIGRAISVKNGEKDKLQNQKDTETGAALAKQSQDFAAKAEKMFRMMTVIQTKYMKDQYERSGLTGSGGIALNGDLIYHLITPQRVPLSSFRSSGISGGHHEQNLQMFLSLHPEYHFVEMKKITALGTTLRLYKQYMWSKDELPPALDDSINRPTTADSMPDRWTEAGVKKGTAEDMIGWLQQGKEAMDKWAEFDADGPSSQRMGRALYEGAPGDKAEDNNGVEFGGRVEYSRDLSQWVITQLVPHIDWMMSHADN